MTISNFMRKFLVDNIENIFNDINKVIFETEKVDINHIYIDGTKIEANANKYTWVWKKSCITNRDNVFRNLTELINEINEIDLMFHNFKIGIRKEYDIAYLEDILKQYEQVLRIDVSTFVYGSGKRKTAIQKHYEKLITYFKRLKEYSKRINTCGEYRNSYSKTDADATFMRIKRDKNGNLLCPNGKQFHYIYDRQVKGNKFG